MNSSRNSAPRRSLRGAQKKSEPSTSQVGVRKQTARKSTSLLSRNHLVRRVGTQKQSEPSTSQDGVRKQTARKSTSLTGNRPVRHTIAAARDVVVSSSPTKVRREAELEKLAHEFVYYLLIADQKKYPIKKMDIVKHVMEKKGKLFSSVMKRANELLTGTFGLRLLEVPSKKECYIITNEHNQLDLSEYQDTELNQRGLLYAILTAIHVNKAPLHEDSLWKMLNSMGIDDLTKDPSLGDVKRLVSQEWVKQLYLKRDMIINSEPAEFQYTFGFRADNEIDINALETFSKKVMNRYDNCLLTNIRD